MPKKGSNEDARIPDVHTDFSLQASTQAKFTLVKTHKAKFYVAPKSATVAGNSFTSRVDGCPLGMVGTKSDRRRGLDVFDGSFGTLSTIAIGIPRVGNDNFVQMIKHVLSSWTKQYNPTTKSMVYQNMLSSQGLTDGTKIFKATQSIVDPYFYDDIGDAGSNEYNVPARQFYDLVYGKQEDAVWWTRIRLRPIGKENHGSIYVTDEHNRDHKDVTENGVVVYKKGGIPYTDTKAIKVLYNSDFYKNGRWHFRGTLNFNSIEWKVGKTVEGTLAVYPIIELGVVSSIVLLHAPEREDAHGLTTEQIHAIADNAVFDGLGIKKASIKRKAAAKAPGFNAPKKPKVPKHAKQEMDPEDQVFQGENDDESDDDQFDE